MELRKARPGNKTLHLDLLLAGIILLLTISLILINSIALILSNRHQLQVDLTANLAYRIGEETETLLSDLNEPLVINVLADRERFRDSSYLTQMLRILEQYPAASPQITLRFVDYLADPTFAAAHSNLVLQEGDVLITRSQSVQQLKLENMFNYGYNAAGQQYIQSSRVEEAVTAAIYSLQHGSQISAAVLSGSRNADVPAFTALLRDNNFDVTTANITTDELSSYDLLILLSPQIDISADAINKLENFLFNSGKFGKTLLYTANVDQPKLPNLETFLTEWGVQIDDGAVFETVGYRTYQMQPYLPIALYEDGKYTDGLRDETMPLMMPLARPFTILFNTRDRQSVTPLLSFSSTAGVRPSDAGEDFKADDSVRSGPIPALVLAVRSETGADQSQLSSNLIISGSTAMLDTAAIENSGLNNAEYMVNLLSDLAGKENPVVIQPKTLGGKALAITTTEIRTLGVILVGVIPAAILLIGFAIWLNRRFK